ncbi:hypothetical protein KNV35_gp31 [uncultured phage cr8_1]|uniref:Uncharacterized protein n=1 Tax=uncultured phage cr8_1 TaxID=2772068 RepID=A0A7M1RXM7_9CAUD|nr:hypothetical protein KNV35_gp31 [uncultured phage cr8_1]QOR58904.1 hypothetical protein [uncultured phage cr8_1]
MCSAYNEPSFSERVQCYISRKEEIEAEYKSKMKALNEEAAADIIANCPIKVGDVYVTESNNAWGVKRQYYKVAKLEANVDGTVVAYGYKRKLDKTWGKRDNIFMFVASIYNDFNIKKFTKVENYDS